MNIHDLERALVLQSQLDVALNRQRECERKFAAATYECNQLVADMKALGIIAGGGVKR